MPFTLRNTSIGIRPVFWLGDLKPGIDIGGRSKVMSIAQGDRCCHRNIKSHLQGRNYGKPSQIGRNIWASV